MTIRIYASGSGALSFVRVDSKGIACMPWQITLPEARQAMIEARNPYEHFKLIELCEGEPLLIPDVWENKETGIVDYETLKFHKISGHWFTLTSGEWHRVYNVSILAALKFHEENPQLYKKDIAA